MDMIPDAGYVSKSVQSRRIIYERPHHQKQRCVIAVVSHQWIKLAGGKLVWRWIMIQKHLSFVDGFVMHVTLPLDYLEIMKKVLKNCWSIIGDLRKGKRNEQPI
jgi:hypothetical protein